MNIKSAKKQLERSKRIESERNYFDAARHYFVAQQMAKACVSDRRHNIFEAARSGVDACIEKAIDDINNIKKASDVSFRSYKKEIFTG